MKTLYVVSAFVLAGAGLLAVSSARQWSQGTPVSEGFARGSCLDRIALSDGRARPGKEEITSPLVVQATAFGLYLDPPKPPEPKVTAPPRVIPPPVARPAVVTPKFRLLAISYYHSHPEKSLAMVSEPGKGSYWIQQGDRVGHLVIERIAEGTVVYRDGGQSHEMKADVKAPIQLAQIKSAASASAATHTGLAEGR